MAQIEVKVCNDDNPTEQNEEEVQDGANPKGGIEEEVFHRANSVVKNEDEVIDTLMIKYEAYVNGNKSTVKDLKVTSDTDVELLTEKCMQLMHGLIRDYKHLSAQITQYDQGASTSDVTEIPRHDITAMTEHRKCDDEPSRHNQQVSENEACIGISRYNQDIRNSEKGNNRREEVKVPYTRPNEGITSEDSACKSKWLQCDKDISEHEDCTTVSSLNNQSNSENDKAHDLEDNEDISENEEVISNNLAYNQDITGHQEVKTELAQHVQSISGNQERQTDISLHKQSIREDEKSKTDISDYKQNTRGNEDAKTVIARCNHDIIDIEKGKIDITQDKLNINENQKDKFETLAHYQDIEEQQKVKSELPLYNQDISVNQERKTDISLYNQGTRENKESKIDISQYKPYTNENTDIIARYNQDISEDEEFKSYISQYNHYISEGKKNKTDIKHYKVDIRKNKENKSETLAYNQDIIEHQEAKTKISLYNQHSDDLGNSQILRYDQGISSSEENRTEISDYNQENSMNDPRHSQISLYNLGNNDNTERRTEISRYSRNISENETGSSQISRYNRDITDNEEHSAQTSHYNQAISENESVYIQISRYNRDINNDKEHGTEISQYNQIISENESGRSPMSRYNRDISDNEKRRTETSHYNRDISEKGSGGIEISRYNRDISDIKEDRTETSHCNQDISENETGDIQISRYNRDISDKLKRKTEISRYNQNITGNESEKTQLYRYNRDNNDNEERGTEISRYNEDISENSKNKNVKSVESNILHNGIFFPNTHYEENVKVELCDLHSKEDTLGVSQPQLENYNDQLLYAGVNELSLNIPARNGGRELSWLPCRNNTDFITSQDDKYPHTDLMFSHHNGETLGVVNSVVYSSDNSDNPSCLFIDDDKMSAQEKDQGNIDVSAADDSSTSKKRSQCGVVNYNEEEDEEEEEEEEDEEEEEEEEVRKIKEKRITPINEIAKYEVREPCYDAGIETTTKSEIGRYKENKNMQGSRMLAVDNEETRGTAKISSNMQTVPARESEHHWNRAQGEYTCDTEFIDYNVNIYRDSEESSRTDSTQTTIRSGNINFKYYTEETDYEENVSYVSDIDAWTTYIVNNDEEEKVVENSNLHTVGSNIYPSDVSENGDTDTSDIILVTSNVADSNIDAEILILSRHKKDVIDILNQSTRLLEKNTDVIFMSRNDVNDILEEVDVENCGNVQVVTRNIIQSDKTLLRREATVCTNVTSGYKYYDSDYSKGSGESNIQMSGGASEINDLFYEEEDSMRIYKRLVESIDSVEREYKKKVNQVGYVRDDLLTYTYNKYNMKKFKKSRFNTMQRREDRNVTTRFTYSELLETSDEGYPIQYSDHSSSTSDQYLTASSSLEDTYEKSSLYRRSSTRSNYKSFF